MLRILVSVSKLSNSNSVFGTNIVVWYRLRNRQKVNSSLSLNFFLCTLLITVCGLKPQIAI